MCILHGNESTESFTRKFYCWRPVFQKKIYIFEIVQHKNYISRNNEYKKTHHSIFIFAFDSFHFTLILKTKQLRARGRAIETAIQYIIVMESKSSVVWLTQQPLDFKRRKTFMKINRTHTHTKHAAHSFFEELIYSLWNEISFVSSQAYNFRDWLHSKMKREKGKQQHTEPNTEKEQTNEMKFTLKHTHTLYL